MSSSETESTAADMSDLSYEQELGEVGERGEVDEGPLQHCRKCHDVFRPLLAVDYNFMIFSYQLRISETLTIVFRLLLFIVFERNKGHG
jgi:hypothetical protein